MKSAARQMTDPAPRAIEPAQSQPAPRPKTRHGSENRKRHSQIKLRTLPEQKERLLREAAAKDMSVQTYLLTNSLGEDSAPPRRPPPRAVAADTVALVKAEVAFNRANNSLNQLARFGNTAALLAEEHGTDRLADAAEHIQRSLDKVRDDFAAPLAMLMAALSYVRER